MANYACAIADPVYICHLPKLFVQLSRRAIRARYHTYVHVSQVRKSARKEPRRRGLGRLPFCAAHSSAILEATEETSRDAAFYSNRYP